MPVQFPGSEVHVLHSDAVGDDFEISVFSPTPDPEQPLPVVYCTDANLNVGTVAGIVSWLQRGMEIPPVRLVCVGYPVGDDLTRVVGLRTRDFTPTRDEENEASNSMVSGGLDVTGGGAEAFLEFLTGELRPWAEAKFNVTDDSTYVGYSEGGLFGVYALFHQPAAFRRYVIGSPWLCWNRPVSTSYEAEYAESHDDLDAVVFLGAGANEAVPPAGMPAAAAEQLRNADTTELTLELGAALERRGYSGLRLTTRIFPEETHVSVLPLLISQGLRAVFAADLPGSR